jgi:hypothetical protein
VESADERERKAKSGNGVPASKKPKHNPVMQFYEEDYDKQVGMK